MKSVSQEMNSLWTFSRIRIVEHTGHLAPVIVEKYGKDAFETSDSCIRVTIPFNDEGLGYEMGDGKLPNVIERTKFGLKYTFSTKIKGKDGVYKSANVVIVVQNDKGKATWRTITLYPDKKD